MPKTDKKDVILSIQGCRFSQNPGDNHMTEIVTDGLLASSRDGYTVSYREPDSDGQDALTTLLVEGERVTMLRSGTQNTQMVFELGRRYVTYCENAGDATTIGVTVSHITADVGENGGRIEVVYGVDVNNSAAEENHFTIDIHAASGTWTAVPDGLTVYRDTFIN